MNTTEENNKLIDELFKQYSNYTSLSEGNYDYLMDKEDFKEAVLEFINSVQKEN